MTISVQCQYRNRSLQCNNRTSNPAGLCHKHVKAGVTLSDINNGTGRMPVMTAIPQLGGARAESADPAVDLHDNRAIINQMAADFKKDGSVEIEGEKPSLGERIRNMFT